MTYEEKIQVGGSAAIMGFDDSDGMQEFLSRTKYKSKIDQVIDFYGVPYCHKNDIKEFMRYGVQERHYPIVHDHFYHVLKSIGHNVDDFDYKKMQEEYNARQDKKPVGQNIQINLDAFIKTNKQELEKAKVLQPNVQDQMEAMMAEIKSLKEQFLPSKKTDEPNQTITAGESKTSETKEVPGEKGSPGEVGTPKGSDKKGGTKGGTKGKQKSSNESGN